MNLKDFEEEIIKNIEEAALTTGSRIIIIDNLTYLCNNSEKGDVAGLFMISLMNLKKKYGWSLLIIAHTPKRSLTSPIRWISQLPIKNAFITGHRKITAIEFHEVLFSWL